MPTPCKPRTTIICAQCSSPFDVPPHRVRAGAKFCSLACSSQANGGKKHALYNGGLSFDRSSGRWKVMCRDGTQMWFYRAVMAGILGRLLRPDEIVHHINGNPSDDRPENLEVTTRAAHINHHRAELVAGRR